MLLTPEQLQKVQKIVEKHHNAFIVSAIGPEAVDPAVLQELEQAGLIEGHLNSVEQAYLYGQLLGVLQNKAAASMSFDAFQKYVRKNPIPLSVPEQRAVKFAQLNAAGYLKGLGNKVNQQTGNILIEADAKLRAKLEKITRDKTAQNIAKRETAKQLKSDLGWASEDWTRDWDRIAVTEKQTAMQTGLADHIAKRYGEDALVAKRVMPDSCRHCSRLYDGPDGNPRIFPLSVLVANGTNVGKKSAEWQAVIGTVHPHCQCQLIHVPAGYGFNKEGELVPGGKGGKVYKSEAELCRAVLREDDLRKALSGGEQLVHLWGLPIHIENPAGTSRTFHTPDGGTDKTWMLHAYGEILGTTGADDDPLDVFIGPDPDSEMVYVIEQQNPETGIWDEQKCMLGFSNQEDAERAYGLSYDRPEKFFLQTNPMEVEAFKRWVGLTRVQSAEESPKIRLVIPLPGFGKSGQVSADIGAATSQEGNRAGGHGTAANYLVETPKRRVPEKGPNPHIDPTDLLRDWKDEEEEVAEGLKRDKEIYTVTEPLRNVYPIVLPDAAVTGQDSAREGTEERRRYVIGNAAKVALRPQDKADLEKSMISVIATGPRGGKIVGWDGSTPIYLRNGQETKEPGWTARLLGYLNGHLRPHHTDPDLVVLKFSPGHKGVIEQLRKHFGIQAQVEPGPTYHRITVSRAVFQKIEDSDPRVIFPEKEKPAPAPAPKPAPKSSAKADIVFAPEKVERVGEIQLVPKSEMKVPAVLKGFMRNGAKVTATVKGKKQEGTFIGTDQAGHPIIDFGPGYQGPHDEHHATQLHFADWKNFESHEAGPEYYKSATHDLPDKCFVRPNERHQKILDELMTTPAVGSHTSTEYTEWLWKRGRETYLVGGAVRDLLNLVKPGSDITDEKVISKLKDFDMVTTADASVMKSCFNQVGADLPPNKRITSKPPGDEAWMTVCATKSGPGIDLTGMVSYTTADGEQCENPVNGKYWPDIRVDHEMRKDYERRDFTCNSIYYDPKNKVIIDPTGRGIADAQAMVLRLPIPIKDMPQNDSLSCRYYKFRMRDWIPDKDTHDQCIAHFEATFKRLDVPHRAAILHRTICKKGGTPEENLANLRKIMERDGVGDLYADYIAADHAAIVGWINEKLKAHK